MVRHGPWKKKRKTFQKYALCFLYVCETESLPSIYISNISLSPGRQSQTTGVIPLMSPLISFGPYIYIFRTQLAEWCICWGLCRGEGVKRRVDGGGKSGRRASQIPWCPASRPKWPIRHVYSSPPPSADAALVGPDEKRWQLRRRLISVTINTLLSRGGGGEPIRCGKALWVNTDQRRQDIS